MSVPSSQIDTLFNHSATRRNIRDHFEALAINSCIQVGDPILIFYAGHGAETDPPKGWKSGGGSHPKIQMLCPYDFVPSTNNSDDAQGIPDLTLATLLNQLAKAKGDNIVRDLYLTFF